jgi:hypothetical protein
MSQRHHLMLNRKRAALEHMESTVHPDANVQPASSKGWQASSAAGVAYPAVGDGVQPVVLASYQVPMGMSGALTGLVIVHVGADGSFVDNSGVVAWHLTKNGFPVPGYENILAQVGSIQDPQGTYLLLQQNDLIQVTVNCLIAGEVPVGNPFAKMIGYLAYGGQGTYVSPSQQQQQRHHRRAGANRYAPGSSNGSGPNSFGAGGPFNRQW